MAHRQQLAFLRCVKTKLLLTQPAKVFEIGSHDVNGSIREIFDAAPHIGVDLSPGKNVDCVASGHEINLKDAGFNICISSECFEHNPFWIATLRNMIDHLPNGGVLIVTAATHGRPEHGTSRTDPSISPGTSDVGWDYYKNVAPEELEKVILDHPLVVDYFLAKQSFTNDVYLAANIRATNGSPSAKIDLNELKSEFGKIKFRPINAFELLYQFWLLPMRIIKVAAPEDICINIFFYYEKFTKKPISRLIRLVRNRTASHN